jgi:predicted dehydrogenase
MDFVSIVTPNHMHFPAAKLALESGFHVLSDKPATFNLAQAKELAEIVKKSGKLYGVTYNYTGYPMIRQARQMIEQGKLGEIRKVVVEYPQGWLATMLENTGQKQASWRVDPAICGAAGCMGDIGTHAINLAEYVTGLHIKELAADLTIFLGKEGRRLEDDGNVLLRFTNGAKGVLHSSQISVGCENNLSLRVYGELGGIEWSQLDPNTMIVTSLDQPKQIYRTSMGYLGSAAAAPPAPRWPSRRLPRRLREPLQKLHQPHPRHRSRHHAEPARHGLPVDRGRRRRHGLHRSRGGLLRQQRRLDAARLHAHHACQVWRCIAEQRPWWIELIR